MRAFFRGCACVLAVTAAGCSEEPAPAAPTPVPAFERIVIEGAPVRYLSAPGDTLQLRAMAMYSDGSQADVTGATAWSSANPAVLSVSPQGLVTTLAHGGGFVRAAYRGWATEVNVTVQPPSGVALRLTGIVRDAATGSPVAGARVRRGDGDAGVATDGNGYFEHAGAFGPRAFTVSMFGYADGTADVPPTETTAHVVVRLAPNPGAYIERTLEGEFEDRDPLSGLAASTTIRVVTRAGGVFDAVAESRHCDYNGSLSLSVRSGDRTIDGVSAPVGHCSARLRFVVPASECFIKVWGYKAGPFRLTFREPR